MRNLPWKIVFILGLLALCLWSVFPPSERIRLGKDLRGGVSLIYHVRIDPKDPDPQRTLTQVITVLKERVNPQGILDISMQPLGQDRIEIVMPIPNPEVQSLREAYEDALEALLRKAQIPAGELQAALEANQAGELFGVEGGRGEKIQAVQDAYNALQTAWDALEQAQQAGASPQELAPLQDAVATAEIEFESLRDAALRLSVGGPRVERALRLSTDREPERDKTTGKEVVDPVTGEPRLQPSPREVELDSLESGFPHLADDLGALVSAYDAYAAKRTGFDDPEDLMRLLRGAGVLEFRIAVRASKPEGVNPEDLREQLKERGPENTDSPVAKWFPINDLKQWYDKLEQLVSLQADPVAFFGRPGLDLVAGERDGQYYLLLYTTDYKSLTHEGEAKWSVDSTFPTPDRLGRPAVGFRLDQPGGGEMNRLTGPHVGEPMAIVLDGQVYSAPTLQSQIGIHGIITGTFSDAEINYLIRVLAAGSLEARLTPEPIAINTLGPSIGADNLHRGLDAFVISIIAVAAFMMLYYFFAGMVADFALVANGVIIFGVMSMIDGTFTLPGLAGIVLTIGMAVDANVLIYERIREELFAGETDLRGAIRLGYQKALSTIIDANVTNLIICFVLFRTATTEVKGFALTLSIGICATLFTALFVTRVIYELYTDTAKFRRFPMLPTVFPAIHRLLEPSINWLGLRKFFWTLSAIAIVASIALVGARGVDMFDTEFRGGVAVTMLTAVIDEDRDGEPDELDPNGDPVRYLLPHTGPAGVEARIRELGDLLAAAPGAPESEAAVRRTRLLAGLRSAGVITRPVEELPPVDQIDTDPELRAVKTILVELAKSSVLTVGRTEMRGGIVHAPSFQIKVASPRGLGEERTITDVVVAAIISEFGDQLDVTRPLDFDGAGSANHAAYTFPIEHDSLGQNIGRPRYTDRVTRFLGGVAIVIDDIDPPVTTADVEKRISRMRAQPDFAPYVGRDVGVFGLETADRMDPGRGYSSLAVAVYDPDVSVLKHDFDLWEREVAQKEWELVSQALQRQTSLEQVSSFSSAVAATLSANAIVAVALSLLGILIYIWVRFGSLRYSVAAIAALVHDVSIALGLLALTAWVGRSALSSVLLIEEFRIDLGVVAALLTIIGYSLNDTIVILDRIRENRGKLPIPTPEIVNKSINQTVSRTVLTSFTTLLAVGIMYGAGGSGIRPFAFCLLTGLVVGTYSSVAIAAPLVVKAARPSGGPLESGIAPNKQWSKEETTATTG
ncbi:MAG: protein translocase subunit SecD [Planctomycetota bacterium]|jgi:SecD/SecF fusion protein